MEDSEETIDKNQKANKYVHFVHGQVECGAVTELIGNCFFGVAGVRGGGLSWRVGSIFDQFLPWIAIAPIFDEEIY
jgi:hypothetical protein